MPSPHPIKERIIDTDAESVAVSFGEFIADKMEIEMVMSELKKVGYLGDKPLSMGGELSGNYLAPELEP
jgi:hypothetical protein